MSKDQIINFSNMTNRNYYQRMNTHESELDKIYKEAIDRAGDKLKDIAPYVYSEEVLNDGYTKYSGMENIEAYLNELLPSLQEEKGYGMTR